MHVGVDNGECRKEIAACFKERCIPVIFIAVDLFAKSGYVFVQEPGKACFGCKFPKSVLTQENYFAAQQQ